jgi:hypothetical protein
VFLERKFHAKVKDGPEHVSKDHHAGINSGTFLFSEFCAFLMSVSPDQSVVKEFMHISGATKSTATRYLLSANSMLTRALDLFYAESGGCSDSPVTAKPKRMKVCPKSPAISKEIGDFFGAYADEENNLINPDGLARLCADLNIDHLDVVWLSIACACEAETMGYFTKEEWIRGMNALDTVTLDELKLSIESIRSQLSRDFNEFKRVYKFAFSFSLEPGARNISSNTATQLWELLIPLSGWKLGEDWLEFLKTDSVVGKAITRDIWSQLALLMKEAPDRPALNSLDSENGAWPILIDEFIEYMTIK